MQSVHSAEERLKNATALHGRAHPSSIEALVDLAATYRSRRRYREAAALQRELVQMRESTLGSDAYETLWARAELARTLRELGRLDEARDIQQDVIATLSNQFGATHPTTIAVSRQLATTIQAQGDEALLVELLEQIVRASDATFGPNNLETLEHKAIIGDLRRNIGDLESAVEVHRQTLDGLVSACGTLSDRRALRVAANLIGELATLGHFDEAIQLSDEVYPLARATLPVTDKLRWQIWKNRFLSHRRRA